jgi:indole-3-glycerol phosphate synthase
MHLGWDGAVNGLGAQSPCPRLPPVASYLDEIVAFHRRRAAAGAARDLELASAVASAPAVRPFGAALAAPGMSVIAEVKRRSPSKGELAPDLDVAALARCYESGGAACLSVLTDEPHFGGSAEDLAAARAATTLPVLRKDFTVCADDVLEARAMGADAVLLIVAALSAAELAEFAGLTDSLGMTSLVEVHDEPELEVALQVALPAGSTVIGVNQRDLRTFTIDRGRACSLGALVPAGVLRVAESGIRGREDVARLEAAGFDAVLVGETLVRSADPAGTLAALRGATLAEEPATCS